MAMLPIFMIGFFSGICLSIAWYKLKADTPSEVMLQIQKDDIIRYKKDIDLLTRVNKSLQEEVLNLKNKLNSEN